MGRERIEIESDGALPFWSLEARKHNSHGFNIDNHLQCMCGNSLWVWCRKHRTWRNTFSLTTSVHGLDDLDDIWCCTGWRQNWCGEYIRRLHNDISTSGVEDIWCINHICSHISYILVGYDNIKKESDDGLPFWEFEARKLISGGPTPTSICGARVGTSFACGSAGIAIEGGPSLQQLQLMVGMTWMTYDAGHLLIIIIFTITNVVVISCYTNRSTEAASIGNGPNIMFTRGSNDRPSPFPPPSLFAFLLYC